jgi:hemerythrin HHE cation binding domain-containing protein
MATVTSSFQTETEIVHREHRVLMGELDELQVALDSLVCYSEVYANLAGTEQVYRCGRHLIEWLPGHFDNEEATVLRDIEKISPELASFSREMKSQHKNLRGHLELFCRAIESFEDSEDLGAAVEELKSRGQEFTRELAAHMGAEERKFDQLHS